MQMGPAFHGALLGLCLSLFISSFCYGDDQTIEVAGEPNKVFSEFKTTEAVELNEEGKFAVLKPKSFRAVGVQVFQGRGRQVFLSLGHPVLPGHGHPVDLGRGRRVVRARDRGLRVVRARDRGRRVVRGPACRFFRGSGFFCCPGDPVGPKRVFPVPPVNQYSPPPKMCFHPIPTHKKQFPPPLAS